MTHDENAKKLLTRILMNPPPYSVSLLASALKDAEAAGAQKAREETKEVISQQERENIELRGLLGHGSDPCIYCGLPKDDMAKCAHGFPGCARADDMVGFDNPWGKK